MAAQIAKDKAAELATATLNVRNINYPMYDTKLTAIENYDRLAAYSTKHSELMMKYLKEPSGPRPLVEPNPLHFAKPYKDWMDD